MVEVPAGMFPGYDYEGLLPVDQAGNLLPVEMDEQEAKGFPKIAGIDTSPAGPPGSPWGDPRVAQAAQIVALLEELWDPLQLNRIVVPAETEPAAAAPSEEEAFVLTTNRVAGLPGAVPPAKSCMARMQPPTRWRGCGSSSKNTGRWIPFRSMIKLACPICPDAALPTCRHPPPFRGADG